MLYPLTRYLLQYGQVCVPHVGTLQLRQRPPVLNAADKVLEPPSYAVELQRAETVSAHQLNFLHKATNKPEGEIERELNALGKAMEKKIASGGFRWEGLGTIGNETGTVALDLPALQPVAAKKVVRQEATHNVLVGDRELTSAQAMEGAAYASSAEEKRPLSVIIGWVLLVLAVLAVALLLYLGRFTVGAAGSRLSPTAGAMADEKFPNR